MSCHLLFIYKRKKFKNKTAKIILNVGSKRLGNRWNNEWFYGETLNSTTDFSRCS